MNPNPHTEEKILNNPTRRINSQWNHCNSNKPQVKKECTLVINSSQLRNIICNLYNLPKTVSFHLDDEGIIIEYNET